MRLSTFLTVSLFLAMLPYDGLAQRPVAADILWPDSWSLDDARSRIQSRERIPVYDDAGEIIPFAEIQARVDESGLSGAFWGGLLGFLVGAAIGEAASPDCPYVQGNVRHFCSPRQEALQERLPTGLGLALGALMVWAGWNVDRTTFEEAIEGIRRERRLGTAR